MVYIINDRGNIERLDVYLQEIMKIYPLWPIEYRYYNNSTGFKHNKKISKHMVIHIKYNMQVYNTIIYYNRY